MMKEDNTTHDECVSLRPLWTPVGHRHVGRSRCSLCGGQSPGKAISKQKGFVKEKFKAGTNINLDHILNEKMLLDRDAWLIAFYEGEMDPHGVDPDRQRAGQRPDQVLAGLKSAAAVSTVDAGESSTVSADNKESAE